MATCQSCGAELQGQYCNTCGARAPEERAPKKPRESKPAAKSGGKAPGLFSPQRIGRTTAMGLIAVLCFGGGMVTGFWIAQDGKAGAPAAATADVSGGSDASLSAIAQAGKFMDEGVDYLNKGERTAATAAFRKAITQYEQVLKEDPNDLYAKTYMGLTYYYIGDSKKALENEQAVLKQDPNYLWALFNLAWIYETGGKKDESVLMYQKYLAVVEAERQNTTKYAEQLELIDRQVEAAQKAVEAVKGGTGK
ncbi:MAG TPA: tetratricopeptide repeat protein [Symbiobacteriaceae bacterium]|nr:tetratricopeptide repeat protein [Symbiobacteriaceae bacterium]